MEYKFTIPRIPGMNEYTDANRAHYGKGGRMKKEYEDEIIAHIRKQIPSVHMLTKPVLIYYQFYEINRRRDNDNILFCAAKFVQDSLKRAWIIRDDGQKYIPHFYFDTFVDKENPRIEVTVTELTEEQAKMTLRELFRDLEMGGG